MDKLKVFSRKLGKSLEIAFNEKGNVLAFDGVPLDVSGRILAWNNYSDTWIDKGWNNTRDGWMDNGWNNYSDSWTDNGWNNYRDTWIDKGWNNTSDRWTDASGGNGSACYITTCCMTYKGLPDNCVELEVLRKYRDKLIQEDPEFRAKVIEYYRNAPLIIQQIENHTKKEDVYNELYNEMIKPCIDLLNAGQIDKAKNLYLQHYDWLLKKYLM